MEQKSPGSRLREKHNVSEKLLKRKNALIWSGICLGISFWMFCLGILVGRGTAPVEFDIPALQKELAELKKAALEKTRQRYETDSEKADGKTELEFYEALKRAQDPPQPRIEPSKASACRRPDGKETPAVTESTEASVPIKVRAETFKKTKRGVKTALPPTAWTIQVAALKDASEAERMVSQLSQKGYAAYKLTGEISGKGIWHRVRVGRYQKREDTAAVISRLLNDQYSPIPVNTGDGKP